MPNYNHGGLLANAVVAILGQSLCPSEVIIVDDGSTDNSIAVIEEIAAHHPCVRLVRNSENCGVVYSANRGAREATGDFLYFAAADDTVYPGFFLESISLLARWPQAGLCSTMVETIFPDGIGIEMPLRKPRSASGYLPPDECLRAMRRQDCWTGGNSCIYRREAFVESGGLLPELGPACDLFLGMTVALRYGACFIPRTLTGYRLSAGSYSARNRDVGVVFARAAALMRTTYAHLYPSDYVDAWEKRAVYFKGISELRKRFVRQLVTIEDVVARPSALDRQVVRLVRFGLLVPFGFLLAYLLVRLGPKMWTVTGRGCAVKLRYLQARFTRARRLRVPVRAADGARGRPV